MTDRERLDRLGQFVMTNRRDAALSYFESLAGGRWKAPGLQQLQGELQALDEDRLQTVRRCVVSVIDHAIHDFLFALQEGEGVREVELVVDGQSVADLSDGLHGELFTEDGWLAKYSAFGKPPDPA